MKRTLFFIATMLACITSFAQGETYVNGYYRANGTYVDGYYRTMPNYTRNDNWSTAGNINPYTGVEGTKPGGYNSSYYSAPSYNTTYTQGYNTYSTSSYSTYTPQYSNYSTYTPQYADYSASYNSYYSW